MRAWLRKFEPKITAVTPFHKKLRRKKRKNWSKWEESLSSQWPQSRCLLPGASANLYDVNEQVIVATAVL